MSPACGRAARSSLCEREDVGEAGAVGDGALAGALDDGAVGEGIGERDAELEDVGAGVDGGERDVAGGGEVGVAGGEVGDEAGLVGESDRPCLACSPPSRRSDRSSRARMPMSLSPRPERLTMMMSVLAASSGRGVMASAMACALSSAGMMPSVRAELHGGVERLVVGGVGVVGAAGVVQAGVLGTDGGVVETGGDASG